MSHVDLRKQCVEFLEKNPLFVDNTTHISSFLHMDRHVQNERVADNEWKSYLTKMLKPSTHGDHITLQAMAKFLNMQLLVVSKLADRTTVHLILPSATFHSDIHCFLGTMMRMTWNTMSALCRVLDENSRVF